MKNYKNFFAVAFLIFYSCSSSNYLIDSFSSLLTNETAYSKISNISVKIPKDWFIAEDNECNCIDLWLIKNDYKAMISFTKLNLDELVLSKIKDSELSKAVYYSKMFVRMKLGKLFLLENADNQFFDDATFYMNDIPFSAYQYIDNEKRNCRVVVFKFKGKFYECTAVPNGIDDLNFLFSIQNAVLSTLR